VHAGQLCLTLSGTQVALSPSDFATLQTAFRERHHLVLQSLVSEPLLKAIGGSLAQGTFDAADYAGVGSDLRLRGGGALEALHLAMNDPELLGTIERIVQAAPLSSFGGRVYRMLPGHEHVADWHDDLHADRHIGLSINLSEVAYEGGLFQLRRLGSDTLIAEVHNTGLGDAILFRLSPDLQHRVTPVTGAFAKTAFAGWFRPGPHPPAPLNA